MSFRRCIYGLLLLLHVSLAYSKTNMYYKKGEYEPCCRGPPGMHGNPGIPGSPGSNGLNGLNGEKGQKGDKGDTGSKGTQGPQGAFGPKGDKGKRGRKGYTGDRGDKGLPGPTGPLGPEGPKGSKGQRGQSARQPSKVAFSAIRTNPLGPVTEDTTVTFDKVLLNQGENFDIYTSHFVARLNGTYLFIAHVLSSMDYDAYAWITVNNRPLVPMHGDHRSGYGTGSNTVVYHLVQEDHVWVQLMKNCSLLNYYSTFSGYLVNED